MVADKGSNSALKINGKRKACGIIEPNDLPVLNSTNEEINILFVTDGGVVAKWWNFTLEAISISKEISEEANRKKRSFLIAALIFSAGYYSAPIFFFTSSNKKMFRFTSFCRLFNILREIFLTSLD